MKVVFLHFVYAKSSLIIYIFLSVQLRLDQSFSFLEHPFPLFSSNSDLPGASSDPVSSPSLLLSSSPQLLSITPVSPSVLSASHFLLSFC